NMVTDIKTESEDAESSADVGNGIIPMHQETREAGVLDTKGMDGNAQTEETALLNSCAQKPPIESKPPGKLRQMFACPPQGLLARMVTNGMLLAGFLIRNTPVISDLVQINTKWSAALRNIALSIILARAGLGLDPQALKKLKAVCFRLSFGPCISEACTAAVLAHFIMHLPWQWIFFFIASMNGSGRERELCVSTLFSQPVKIGSTLYNVLRGLLEVGIGVAAGGLLGFFIRYFPSKDQASVVWKRAYFLLGLSMFAVFGSVHFGFPGSGGLCTLVLAFLAGLGWSGEKVAVEGIVAVAWDIFQPFLFGLIGAEISVASLRPETVGLCVGTLGIALIVRVIATFLLVSFAGFNLKEKIFISLAWIPKATVQAAIGSLALDTARNEQDEKLEKYGMDVLTVAFLAILITAPVGALVIGLAGPRLLHKAETSCGEIKEGEGEKSERSGQV
uniref:Cation/H+ exchanger transmembrane domain-containing protein n=1 Tax=Sphenodon punctatus TaxID=8508 RepID=A0A8D0H2A1_SPHPU